MGSSNSKVTKEIQRRFRSGHPLSSGANRGDWLYAAAVRAFGSWKDAVEAAGFDYAEVKQRALTETELLATLRELLATGEPILAKDHPRLRGAARRHFGSWREAVAKAGGEGASKWTRGAVIAAIERDLEKGLAVTSNAVRRRNENLYMAGRRRFGSWNEAVTAAAPGRGRPRSRRGRTRRATS